MRLLGTVLIAPPIMTLIELLLSAFVRPIRQKQSV